MSMINIIISYVYDKYNYFYDKHNLLPGACPLVIFANPP